ncbi:MAG: Na/Pi cotransporter family protein [Tissierellales bacterium]|jgi:phosphate:Na+ symporter|nr:Na/Pi cotransporter family protein [Tissierellales bacterium]
MEIAIGVIGGLSLFIFGMTYMGNALQKTAGSKLKQILAALTNKRIMGVFVGAVVTMIVQSSSATTVMTVGFVNAGLMNLNQAIGVIMGANIGTTVTAQLVAFKLTDAAPLIIGAGMVLYLIGKKKKTKDVAEIFIGFGILFLGMALMKEAIEPLEESQIFIDILSNFNNPLIGILAGFGITALLQSSSATTGLLLAVAGSGLITVEMAFPIIFGQNIGTCVTAMISSIGANKTARRAAVMHLLFNLIGTAIFLIVLRKPVESLVFMITPTGIERQIANAHTLFNVINVAIMYPFANQIVKASKRIIRGEDLPKEGQLKYIDNRLIATPSIALTQASKEVLSMGKLVEKQFVTAEDALLNGDESLALEVFEMEKRINDLNRGILEFLVKVNKASLTNAEKDIVSTIMNVINDIERVGDHADNIGELAIYNVENEVGFSEKAKSELKEMFDLAHDMYKTSLLSFKTANYEIGLEVLKKENLLNKMEKEHRSNHIDRLNENICLPQSGIIFLDCISNLERIGDHSTNVAQLIINVVNKMNYSDLEELRESEE